MLKAKFNSIQQEVSPFLTSLDYYYLDDKETGLIYKHRLDSTCLKIDIDICNLKHYPYIDYTSEQNELSHQYDLFLRFSIDSVNDLDRLKRELDFFTSEEPEPEKLKKYGANRQEQEIDPTLPEATFETCFAQAFGEKNLYALTRESEYYDYEGKRRFIDYVLKTKNGDFAIELNGEQFHHPAAIKEKRYASQLFKQNSLAAEGYKVFRWSQRGMADNEKFIQELKYFFGDPTCFNSTPHFKSLRSLKTFKLAEHQHDALAYIDSLREQGRNTFIIVLPTATGKTEIFIEDFYRQLQRNHEFKALVMVPRKALKQQTIDRFISRHSELAVGEDFYFKNKQQVCVQTYAYLLRHYHKLDSKMFDYIVVDEAHHAQANGLKKILEYFQPNNLLGFTATDERLDQKQLEEIFGQYETRMTLKEAMEKGLIPPVSVYRLQTNINLSKVRFNGKDFVKSDLQKTIQIPSRDEMIVDLIKNSFAQPLLDNESVKQGLVFCVDIKHAKRIAKLFKDEGIIASAVSGCERTQSEKALADYAQGKIQFLCACDLLNEGWDSPETSILVMARPTMSKVLYTQQLGRGTRHHKNKEQLYVIDVVDSYGALLQPWSLNSLLGISNYKPFANVLNPENGKLNYELKVLSGLYEHEMRLVYLDLFTLEEQYSDMLSEEQLARELFVSTGTIRSWIKKKSIIADAQLPFGNRTLSFFSTDSLELIRQKKQLKKHTEETRKSDFFDFLEKRDYTFSYKIIFLCLMFKLANDRGEVELPVLSKNYSDFYLNVLNQYSKTDKALSPLNHKDVLLDLDKIQKNILQNPFEKFERKRFMHHCKDLNYISFDTFLWSNFTNEDESLIQQQMFSDLYNYYQKLEMTISNENKESLSFVTSIDELVKQSKQFNLGIKSLFEHNLIDNIPENKKYITLLPFYPLEIAAGGFADSEIDDDSKQWIDIQKIGLSRSIDKTMFISQIHGHSMEPLIPDGSYCLFKYGVVGSRNGRIVLVKKSGYEDPDTQASFTIKRYYSQKTLQSEYEWEHEKIELRPENPDYPVLIVDPDEAESFVVIAEFIQLVKLKNSDEPR